MMLFRSKENIYSGFITLKKLKRENYSLKKPVSL